MKESIENRIEEIENYYESHFDESFVLNYENGILKLKNLLIQNIPNCVNNLDKYISIIKEKPEKKINDKTQLSNLNKKTKDNIKNNIVNNSETKPPKEKLYNNNMNVLNNSESILNNNIFNNKLLFSFKEKEKDLKGFESFRKLQKEQGLTLEQEKHKSTIININLNNNSSENDINSKEENEEEEEEDDENNKNQEMNNNIYKRNNYGELFNLNSLSSERKINTIKTENKYTIWKENENNLYTEERVNDEENSNNNELREKFRLKEVLFEFILSEKEYNLLMKEKAKNINPLKG